MYDNNIVKVMINNDNDYYNGIDNGNGNDNFYNDNCNKGRY